MNTALVRKLEAKVGPELVGKDLTDEVLDEAHEKVLEFLREEFPAIPGLFDYIDGLKFVEDAG
jgi:hypothetical protein